MNTFNGLSMPKDYQQIKDDIDIERAYDAAISTVWDNAQDSRDIPRAERKIHRIIQEHSNGDISTRDAIRYLKAVS